MNTEEIPLRFPIRPGVDALAVFTPLPHRRPVVRAVRITRIFMNLRGDLRFEGVASNPLFGGGATTTHRTQGDVRQLITLSALENISPGSGQSLGAACVPHGRCEPPR